MAGSSWISHTACSSLLQKIMGSPCSFDIVKRLPSLLTIYLWPSRPKQLLWHKAFTSFSVSVLLLLLRFASLHLSCLWELLGLSLAIKIILPNFWHLRLRLLSQLLPRCVFRARWIHLSHASGHRMDVLIWASWTVVGKYLNADRPTWLEHLNSPCRWTSLGSGYKTWGGKESNDCNDK